MSDQAIEFLRGWIDENIHVPAAPIEREAEMLARECAADAAEVGVPLDDIEEEVGNLEDLLVTKLEDALEEVQKPRPFGTSDALRH